MPQKVGTNYLNFGIFLLNDEDGSQIQNIDNDCNGRCDRIMCKILSDWLQGKGKPVVWKELIETLRDCDLNELADTIQEKTQLGDLKAPDDSPREQMRTLQLTPLTPTGTFTCTCICMYIYMSHCNVQS